MKQKIKAYIFLIAVISVITYLFSEYYIRKIDEDVDFHNQRITILFSTHEVLYHIISIREGLYSLYYGTFKTDEPIRRNIKELDEGIENLSKSVGYIYYSGRDDELFRTYSHHVEVIEALYPGFIKKINAALTAAPGIEKENALKEAIEKSAGMEAILEEIEKFMDNEYKMVNKSLPAITADMRTIRNVSGSLLFVAVAFSAYFMFRSCSIFRKLQPVFAAIKKGDYSFKLDVDPGDACGNEIAEGINILVNKIKTGEDSSSSLAIIDPLTGAFNRRYFDMRINEEMNRSIRYSTIFSLSIIDLDHFKEINDTYGHQVGDIVLKELIVLIKENIRDTDIVARYGGEEFVIIYPCTPRSGVLTQIERLRTVVEGHKFIDMDRPVTISAGAADSAGKNDAAMIVQEADSSLYLAKRNGRNQCVIVGVTT
ncbi:MAG: GGDEF domain-containing protein [Nitrospirae bacterium]|nr:GGDEF domain-containing protein [Nitrospirota bacterium]